MGWRRETVRLVRGEPVAAFNAFSRSGLLVEIVYLAAMVLGLIGAGACLSRTLDSPGSGFNSRVIWPAAGFVDTTIRS